VVGRLGLLLRLPAWAQRLFFLGLGVCPSSGAAID
jgi:hypothetical protein